VYARAALVGRMSIGAVAGRGFEIGVVVVISGLKVEGRCVRLRYGNVERTRGTRWDNRVGFRQRFEQTFCGTFKGSLARSSMLLRSSKTFLTKLMHVIQKPGSFTLRRLVAFGAVHGPSYRGTEPLTLQMVSSECSIRYIIYSIRMPT
jgi:hypothetical protein